MNHNAGGFVLKKGGGAKEIALGMVPF